MEHVDPGDLALLALGEPASDADRAHLLTCRQCRDDVDSLALVVATGRSLRPADALVPPPPAVWNAIRAELGLAADAPDAQSAGSHPQGGGLAPVVPLRRRRAPWIAAAAAAGVVVGGAGGALLTGDDAPEAPAVVAQAALEPLPGWATTGQAVVEQTADGQRVLVVTLDAAQGDDGFREVWLIDREVSRLVSLGVLEGTEGTFTVPAGLDLGEFPVVDVSEEPYDGDPAHSGDSIIRGILDA